MQRILTGTPVVKSPLRIYSQSKFLDQNALPFRTFFGFRNHFAIMGGFQGRQVLAYKNLDELGTLMEPWSYRVKKSDCLDLPPQVFLKRRVYMTPEQTKAYKTMREEFYAEVRDDEVNATIVLAQMTRLQQICGGYLTKDGKVMEIIPPDRNPKLLEAKQLLEDAPGQVVVWFRFKPELEGFKQLLKPDSYYEFHGDVKEKDRPAIRQNFKRGVRPYLLGTASTGGIGINEFLVANTVIRVSHDFDTESRIQSDDRTHRMGSEMHDSVTYYDILVPNTVDVKIHRVLRTDTQVSAKVLKEQWREWI
jgi:SNF2 family DNA or RNA helicase